ncbi:hypothetical protein Pcinc_028245, partial [Petrolisthes cinctipes]
TSISRHRALSTTFTILRRLTNLLLAKDTIPASPFFRLRTGEHLSRQLGIHQHVGTAVIIYTV